MLFNIFLCKIIIIIYIHNKINIYIKFILIFSYYFTTNSDLTTPGCKEKTLVSQLVLVNLLYNSLANIKLANLLYPYAKSAS